MLVKLLDPAPILYIGRVLAPYRADPSSFRPSDELGIQKNITVCMTCEQLATDHQESDTGVSLKELKYPELSDPSCFVQIRSRLRLKMVSDTDYYLSLTYAT